MTTSARGTHDKHGVFIDRGALNFTFRLPHESFWSLELYLSQRIVCSVSRVVLRCCVLVVFSSQHVNLNINHFPHQSFNLPHLAEIIQTVLILNLLIMRCRGSVDLSRHSSSALLLSSSSPFDLYFLISR